MAVQRTAREQEREEVDWRAQEWVDSDMESNVLKNGGVTIGKPLHEGGACHRVRSVQQGEMVEGAQRAKDGKGRTYLNCA
jgi:hypothetical protein